MKKVVLYFADTKDRNVMKTINYVSQLFREIILVGVSASTPITFQMRISENQVKQLPYFAVNDLGSVDYDILLICGEQYNYSSILRYLCANGISNKKVLPNKVVWIPNFTLEKYRALMDSQLSIFAMNCFAGILSHTMTLPFRTPFINMFESESDFLTFLENPRKFLSCDIKLVNHAYEKNLKFNYPIYDLNGIRINMNHYNDEVYAERKWKERVSRINWYNLFVTMYTDSKDTLERFDALPYGKKVCFTSFPTDIHSGWYLDQRKHPGMEMWDVVNHFAGGQPFYYDVWDMLLYGKKTSLV